jgi:hypothetical protein
LTRPSSAKLRKTGNGRAGRSVRLINQRQAIEEFDLTIYAIYKAIEEDLLDPLQVNGEGRAYYSVRQLEELRKRLTNSYSTLPNAA